MKLDTLEVIEKWLTTAPFRGRGPPKMGWLGWRCNRIQHNNQSTQNDITMGSNQRGHAANFSHFNLHARSIGLSYEW